MSSSERSRRWRRVVPPALLVLLVAPVFGESLSGSTPPLDLVLPWNLAYMVALYGCGALVCREVAHRFRLGFVGLVWLGVAYGVWEEALVDRYWFFPRFWDDSGVGRYSVVGDTNVLLAAHLTAFHTAISICASVLVVEWTFPAARHRPWVARPGLAVAAVVLALTPLIYGELDQRPPTPVLVAASLLLVGVVLVAFLVGRRAAQAAPSRSPAGRPGRGIGVLAFGCVLAHWVATYAVPDSGLPWPAGVGLALLPVLVGVVVVRRLATTGPYGSDGVRVVVGLLSFFALLDVLVALLGRYDMLLSAALAVFLAQRLYRRRASIDEASARGGAQTE